MAFLKAILFALLLSLAGSNSFAQQVDLDSLQKNVNARDSDTGSVRKLMIQAERYRYSSVDAALICAAASVEKSREGSPKRMQADAELILGIVYQDKSDFVNAILHLTNAQKISEQINYDWGLMRCFNSLGNCYALQKQLGQAIAYYRRALELCVSLKENRKRSVILGNIGNLLYMQTGTDARFRDSAIAYYKMAHHLDSLQNDTPRIISMLSNLALVYADKRELRMARTYLAEVQKLIGASNNLDAKVNYYNYMSRVLGYERDYAGSNLYLDSSAALAKEVGSVNMLAEVYIARSDNAYETKDYKTAYDYLMRYKQVTDSILNAENFAAATDIQNKYQREKKQREIERLTLRDQNQRIIIISIVVFFVVLVVFAFVLYRRLQENRRQKAVIEQQRNEMLDSIHYAKRIQTALLASEELLNENLPEHFILYKPKDIVSGDFYWASVQDGKFIFCLGDCTGHGVPGAFMSLLNISKLNEAINERKNTRPDLVLNEVRKEIIRALNPKDSDEAKDGMDCVLCKFDFGQLQLQYAAANNGLLVVRDNQALSLVADHMPVGKSPKDDQPFTLSTFQLKKGDQVYLFTDGFADQFGGPSGKKFKIKNLREAILASRHLDMSSQKSSLERVLAEWRGDLEQVDDVALVGIRL